MTIGILHPNSGNITSIRDALERLDLGYKVLREPRLKDVTRLILPGQGRFGPVMRYLNEKGWIAPLRAWTESGKPLLAICVGMQILFEGSEEDPAIPGLGLLRGRAARLRAAKLPMIGWAHVHWRSGARGTAYFVNGYAVENHPDAVAWSTHGNRFCAALSHGSIRAFQFHPEKSGAWGKELLRTCLIS